MEIKNGCLQMVPEKGIKSLVDYYIKDGEESDGPGVIPAFFILIELMTLFRKSETLIRT